MKDELKTGTYHAMLTQLGLRNEDLRGGETFPAPSRPQPREVVLSPPAGTLAKAALYVAMREARVSKVEMARRLGVDEKEVRRLLDPHQPSKLPRIAQAIGLLGRRLVIQLRTS